MAWRFKDALITLVDVGRSMQEPTSIGAKRSATKAETAVGVARNQLQQKLLFNPRHEVALVFFGTRETRNALQADGYEHVLVASPLEPPKLELLATFSAPPPGGEESDAVNALIVALDLMINHTREGRFNKTIQLLTDGASASPGDEDLLECANKLEVTGTKLRVTLMGTDVGVWSALAQSNAQVELIPLAAMAKACGLSVKPVEQRAKVRVPLIISPELQIPVSIYTRTTRVTFPTLQKRSRMAGDKVDKPSEEMGGGAGGKGDKVLVERVYHTADDPDGEEVRKEDRVKGHRYGSSIVPMSEYDEAALMYTCERTLLALGFASANSVGPEHSMKQLESVAADRGDPRAFVAMESLIEAMQLEQRVLIARYSFRKNSPPWMVALIPRSSGKPEQASWLEMQYLPFTEDIREWSCASLPPASASQRNAAGVLVDAMGLGETLLPEEMHNPALGRFYNFLTRRALDPAAKVPAPSSEACSLERSPEVLLRLKAGFVAEQLKGAFGLKRVEQSGKAKKRFWREAIAEKRREGGFGEVDTKLIKVDVGLKKPEKDEDDVKAELHDRPAALAGMAAPVEPPPRVHVGSVNPERDFERYLAMRAGGCDVVGAAVEQMQAIILRLADEGEDFLAKALGCLTCLRRGCVREGEAEAFNSFVRRLRLGETKRRTQLWERAREASLGLITDAEVPTSAVCEEEARAFLAGEVYVSPKAASGSAGAALAPVALSERDLEAMLE